MEISKITQRYFEAFPADYSLNPQQRQTPEVLLARVNPENFPNASLLIFNEKLSKKIGLGAFDETQTPFLVGNSLPSNIQPYSTAYAGHQFGNWAGQLGDGRVIFAGEIADENGNFFELQWKGAGATPYSRHADGRAVFRSSIREYLMSEAMYHLGIPTTRALSLSITGEKVIRDMLYNGNPQYEKGAVVMRASRSFLRFGHFEFAHAQKDYTLLRQLADFIIANYYPDIPQNDTEKYKILFQKISQNTLDMVVQWLRVGFVHGVMNTDNMSILGETIDYGPFAILEEYDLNFTSNTTDLPQRRYAFGRQPQMAQWNLWQLANAMFPLVRDEAFLEHTLNAFGTEFWQKHDEMMMKKFGIAKVEEQDGEWLTHWQKMMTEQKMDYTLFFTQLEKARVSGSIEPLLEASYLPKEIVAQQKIQFFFDAYTQRLTRNPFEKQESLELMNQNNPKFVLRNYLLYQCIEEVNEGKMDTFHRLIQCLQNPYQIVNEDFHQKRPAKYNSVAGCSMLSCSS